MVRRALIALPVLLMVGCTSATYERTDTGTTVSYTSVWKDFEGIDAAYMTPDVDAALTVGSSGVHALTPEQRAALGRFIVNTLFGGALPATGVTQ